MFNDSKLQGLHPKALVRFAAFLSEVQNWFGYAVNITSGIVFSSGKPLQKIQTAVRQDLAACVYLAIDRTLRNGRF